MSITFVRWEATARLYAVLAHLNLGRDAASMYDPELPSAPWVPPLLEAYRTAPGRLELHGLGLVAPENLTTRLRERPSAGLMDPSGRRLCALVADAMQLLARTPVPFASVPSEIVVPLESLRDALWERQGSAPPLTVVDCPALGKAGRASWAAKRRIVAVSLAEPVEHLLCQVLHEETHAVTDPVVSAQWVEGGPVRDTALGSAGYARHQALETAAVEVGEALVRARGPQWLDAYHRWRRRFGA